MTCTGKCKTREAAGPQPGQRNYWTAGGVKCKRCKTYLTVRVCPCDPLHHMRKGGPGTAAGGVLELKRQKIPKIPKKGGYVITHGGKDHKKTKRVEIMRGGRY